jgi:putative hydrolase of HD superfamily
VSVFDHIDLADKTLRSGWVKRGIERPETVGRHIRECVKLASEMADELGVDKEKLMAMMAVHDLPESDPTVGDIIPAIEGITAGDGVPKEEKTARERAAMRKICADLPDGAEMLALWEEFEAGETPEAKAAKQIDAFQLLLQARRYNKEQGLDIRDFAQDVDRRVTHPVLRERLGLRAA